MCAHTDIFINVKNDAFMTNVRRIVKMLHITSMHLIKIKSSRRIDLTTRN